MLNLPKLRTAEIAEPIVDLLNRGVAVVGIAARVGLTGKNRVAGKWRRNGLKRLNPRRKMVWSRKPLTHKIWYTGAQLAMRDSGWRAARTKSCRKRRLTL